MKGTRNIPRLLMALVGLICLPQTAAALSCNASISNLDFGSISVRAGAVNQTSGTVTVSCTGSLIGVVGTCVYFGAGSGGAGGNNSPRYMRRGDGAALPFELRQLGNGNTFGTLNALYIPVTTLLGSGSATVPFFADITSNSVSVGSGTYQSNFSGPANIELEFGDLTACNLVQQRVSVPPFTVAAEVVPSCELDVTALSFGTISSSLNQPVDETATINVRCTSSTSYSVSLGQGGGGTSASDRRLRNGSHDLSYGLYSDSSRVQPWGNLPGNSVAATGTGANSAFTVYGRIHAGQNAKVGIYSDNVVVTITY